MLCDVWNSQEFWQCLRKVKWACMKYPCLCQSLLGFGMGIMFANVHMCGMIMLFNAMWYMLVRYVSPRGPMCFRCLMFNLV